MVAVRPPLIPLFRASSGAEPDLSIYHLGSSLARRLQPDTALPDLSIEFHLASFRFGDGLVTIAVYLRWAWGSAFFPPFI